jgi:hypothetical protein
MPKPMINMPPITAHEFYQRFYSAPCKRKSLFHLGHICNKSDKGHCQEALWVLPKKLSKLDENNETRETFWGIYAREVICFRWIMFYNILCFLPSITFFIVSILKLGKSFDLQDPSVPFAMTAAMLSVFWSQLISSLDYGGQHL